MMSAHERITYDLLKEPWLPCEDAAGQRVWVGIENALLQAHRFTSLYDESPLATVTLHRLLLAILQRVFSPRTADDWMELWQNERFDAGRVSAYLNQWKD